MTEQDLRKLEAEEQMELAFLLNDVENQDCADQYVAVVGSCVFYIF